MYPTTIGRQTLKRIGTLGKVDIIVGIPCYNAEDTFPFVVRQVTKGLLKYFPGLKKAIVISDSNSTDRTVEVAERLKIDRRVEKIINVYRAEPGKGMALRAVFEVANKLRGKGCMVVDSDLRSITPEWISGQLKPIMQGDYDFVAPYYIRHKYDGTITNNIVYPVTRALYGKRVRQPIGGDFSMAGRLIGFFLDQDWDEAVGKFGIDVWMTTLAVAENFRIAQAFLGTKIHNPKDPSRALGPMFRQVLSTLFKLMEQYENIWFPLVGSFPIPTMGTICRVKPQSVQVNLKALAENFSEGYDHFSLLWREILSRETFAALKDVTQKEGLRNFSAELWARVVYDFACKYHHWTRDRFKLISLMTPLYYGRVGAFVSQTRNLSSQKAEEIIESQAETFEELKPYLVKNWKRK